MPAIGEPHCPQYHVVDILAPIKTRTNIAIVPAIDPIGPIRAPTKGRGKPNTWRAHPLLKVRVFLILVAMDDESGAPPEAIPRVRPVELSAAGPATVRVCPTVALGAASNDHAWRF
ncbi:MAG: hypothetical protein JRI36_07110 [Deltaproteobacteria bacterium]|nr:hypothetical protein [Deltaproteobacteria bacterium]